MPKHATTTNNSSYTAKVGDNSDHFPVILKLYLPSGGKVLDTSYGKGTFWRNVDRDLYDVWANDINEGGCDARALSQPILDEEDEVCSGRQCPTHVEIINALPALGYRYEDLFVLVNAHRPSTHAGRSSITLPRIIAFLWSSKRFRPALGR